jgi:hypothetical protein
MATPRAQLVDETVTPWYHCVSRCVRQAFLCGEGAEHRKVWIEHRLKELVSIFSIDCAGFAVMDNHIHLLLRLDSQRMEAWSAEEVARRWATLFPLRDITGRLAGLSGEDHGLAGNAWVAATRKRLVNLGWFMKCLKEPLARLANKEDGCSGAFWEGRFKSVAVLDEASFCYSGLHRPESAGRWRSHAGGLRIHLAACPSDHCRVTGTLETVHDLSTQTHNPAQEAGLWLLPVADERATAAAIAWARRGVHLSVYLRLVDWTSRLVRR